MPKNRTAETPLLSISNLKDNRSIFTSVKGIRFKMLRHWLQSSFLLISSK